MTIKFCIETSKKEYIKIEFTQGKADEFLKKLFNDYKINKHTPSDVKDVNSCYNRRVFLDSDDGSKFEYFNFNARKTKEQFVLYNNKFFIREFYCIQDLNLLYRMRFGVYYDKLNQIDKENTGILVGGKFLSIDKLYNRLNAINNLDVDTNRNIVIYDKDNDKVEIGLKKVNEELKKYNYFEAILDVKMTGDEKL